ncbi:unnamed protein product [Camellia sinensis]
MTAGGARLLDRRSSKKIICDAAAAAGATAGAIAATFVCPLDVIKTRLQVHGLPEAHHSVQKYHYYKPTEYNTNRGFEGTVPWPLTNIGGTTSKLGTTSLVYFTVYGYLKDLLHTHGCSYCDNTVNNSGQLTFGANMIAASGAGAVTKEILNPLVKCTVTGGAFDQVRLGETVKETEGVLGRVQLK